MKTASTATLAILASGQYLKIEFWSIKLNNGLTFYFTSGDGEPLTIGGNIYATGIIFVRDQITQKAGTEVGSLDMTIEPQFDRPGGQPLIAGGPFLSQLRAGVFDNAIWTLSKGFFNKMQPGQQLDVSPGIVPWWQGITSNVLVGRTSAEITLDESTAILANQQMPRNMIQAGCVHRLFDFGCTVPVVQNTYTGALTVAPTTTAPYLFTTNLASSTFGNGFFNLGIIKFTSGVLNGVSFTVSLSVASGGNIAITTIMPLPSLPAISDTFSIQPGCDKTFPTCSSTKFKNTSGIGASFARFFRGAPFVPQPETLYDGGTGSQLLKSVGNQGSPVGGSPFTGVLKD
jgi:hypothetical protein